MFGTKFFYFTFLKPHIRFSLLPLGKFFGNLSRQGSKPSKNFSFNFDFRYTNLMFQQKITTYKNWWNLYAPLMLDGSLLQMVLWFKCTRSGDHQQNAVRALGKSIIFSTSVQGAACDSHRFDYAPSPEACNKNSLFIN